MNLHRILAVSLLVYWLAGPGNLRAEDLNCLPDGAQHGSARLYTALQGEAYEALAKRRKAYEALKTPEQIAAYQKRLRTAFVEQLGGFPKKAPLNAKTVGTIRADGYRVEKVIYDSQPSHRITANLYLPDGQGPFPGVVVSSGHSRTGKTAAYNQRFGIMMAKYGMAALCFDPIGQGERSQILNDRGDPRFSSTTTEHFLVGVGSILVGRNTARYRIWDAMRSIDYLVSRKEIDPQRIGMTGCSGGGTLTSYVMALDDRVACAAPACYLTTMKRLIETIGPQDAEQNIFAQLKLGLDQPDYVLLRAPRPTLISSTTNDFFDIDGAWDNFRQAKRIYARLGRPECVTLVEVEGKHGVQPENLAAIAQWMQRWLLEKDEDVPVAELETRAPQELLCTTAAQVLQSDQEKSVFDLNAEFADELAKRREKLWRQESHEKLKQQIAELIGLPEQEPAATTTNSQRIGSIQREGKPYVIEKRMAVTGATPLPMLVFKPNKPNGKVTLYLTDQGKNQDAGEDGPIDQLASAGVTVYAVDLRGQGETGPNSHNEQLGHWKTYFLAYLLGKSLVGMRTEDVMAVARIAGAESPKTSGKAPKVHLVARGNVGVVGLHAAALAPELFTSVELHNTPADWTTVVGDSLPLGQLESTVHGALEVYDLPNLVDLAGRDRVRRVHQK